MIKQGYYVLPWLMDNTQLNSIKMMAWTSLLLLLLHHKFAKQSEQQLRKQCRRNVEAQEKAARTPSAQSETTDRQTDRQGDRGADGAAARPCCETLCENPEIKLPNVNAKCKQGNNVTLSFYHFIFVQRWNSILQLAKKLSAAKTNRQTCHHEARGRKRRRDWLTSSWRHGSITCNAMLSNELPEIFR